MTVHSLHIFDRKGKTLFTKIYSSIATKNNQQQLQQTDPGNNPLEEQRKLVFGMILSMRELVGSLTPKGEKSGKCLLLNFLLSSRLKGSYKGFQQ